MRGHQTLAAIMLTDAVGFSARMSVNEELTLQLIQQDLQLMRTLCEQYDGRVLKSTGDGLLMAFASAVQAVNCGLEIQRQLQSQNQQRAPDQALLHRIGIHLGDVFFSESDVMGNGVNIADRLQTEAEPGGLCISQTVYDVVKSRLTLNADYAGPLNLKNIRDPVPAYRIHPLGEAGRPAPDPVPNSPQAITQGSREKLTPGMRIGGRYLVQRVLGQGGFGRSYLAEDTQRFNEACVLKEFFPTNKSGSSLQKAVDLFKREAKTLYQINHPQVPKFLACFTQAQRLFLVQEYIDGVPYSQLLRQRRQQGERFSEAEVIDWLGPMLEVLDYLHSLNIVHRDISPDNIMYCRDRNLPVLIDFGLVNDAVSDLMDRAAAEAPSGAPDAGTIDGSKPATIVGKFGYSPPEQMHLGQCFPCSDLYALGVTAIVLLTGKYPRDLIDRDSLEWRWQVYASPAPNLTVILDRLLRQKPKERFQTARQVLEALALANFANQRSSGSTVNGPPPPPRSAFAPAVTHHFPLAEPSGQMDPAFLAQCRQALTRCIGPMASFVLNDAIEQHPGATPAELVHLIAAQLSDGDQATAFVSGIQIAANPLETAPSGRTEHLSPGDDAGPDLTPPGLNQIAATLTPEFVARCRQVLAHCIGPMAILVLEETLEDYPNLDPQGLVEKLAQEIPNDKQANEFRQQLL